MPIPNDTDPIPRQSARQRVYDHLRRWIESGALEAGELVRDGEIAKRLGVSRTPVREALQMLEQSGFIEMTPGRETRVSPISVDDIALVYAPLAALEALAAEIGTPRATPSDVEKMISFNDDLLHAIDRKDSAAARRADTAFHDVLVGLTENRYLAAAIKPLLFHVARLETAFFEHVELGHGSYEQHKEIIAAVAAGDVTSARENTRRNFHRHLRPEGLARRSAPGFDDTSGTTGTSMPFQQRRVG